MSAVSVLPLRDTGMFNGRTGVGMDLIRHRRITPGSNGIADDTDEPDTTDSHSCA
jgi:hypothetical protein